MPQPLADVSPAELCLRLAGQGASGVLRFDGPRGRAHIRLRLGDVVAARAPGMLSGRTGRLGERLLTAGKLDRPDLDAVLMEQRDAGNDAATVGELLVQRGLAAPDYVRLAIQEQMLEGLLEIMAWYEGTWDFEGGDGESPAGVSVALPVDRALMEVRRRLGERDRVQRLVPSPTSVPRPVPDVTAPSRLAPDEFALLASIDGLRSVGTIAGELGFAYDEASRLLYRLILQGLAEVADGTGSRDDEERPVSETRPATAVPPQPRLEDDGWAQLRQSSSLDGPEPWVGWAHGAPEEVAEDVDEPAAATPDLRVDRRTERHSPTAPPTVSTPEPAEPSPLDHEVAPPPAAASDEPPDTGVPLGPAALDADTRRQLFSELRDVSIDSAPREPEPPTEKPAPRPEPAPEPEAEAPAASDEPDGRPRPEPRGADISELLRELHELSMDDPEPPAGGGGATPSRSPQDPDDDARGRRRFGR